MQIIDGKKIRDEILAKIKKEVDSLPFKPIFCDVLVGDDPSSTQYVKMKKKTAESVGIEFHNAFFKSTVSTEDLIKEIKILNKIPNMCGIIIQLPLPEGIDKRAVLDAISPVLDVDCLGSVASEKFYSGETKVGSPTALACMELLYSIDLNLENKKIVVLGQGELVGRPVAALLQSKGFSPFLVDSKTLNKEEIIKKADVLISGIGKGKYLKGEMVKKGVVLIDAGTSEEISGPSFLEGRVNIVGDVDLDSVSEVASFLSPVPGGVGPVTIAMLLDNVLNVAKQKIK